MLGRILTEIATNAAPTAIVELIRWLDSFHFEGEVPLPELARLVATLDEAAQPQLRQAAGLYLSNVFGSRSVRYKALGRDFYASLGRAYDLVLNGLSGDFSIEPSDSLRTEVLLRTVRAAAGEMKWVAFDYQELAPDVWQRAASAYRAAYVAGGLNLPINLREGRETRSTVSREFIRLVAMQCASLDQLSPDRIEAADKLVRYLQHSLALSVESRGGGQFWIDLDTLAQPQRCLGVAEDAPASIRYFQPGDVVPLLGELRQTLEGGSLGPGFAGIGAPSNSSGTTVSPRSRPAATSSRTTSSARCRRGGPSACGASQRGPISTSSTRARPMAWAMRASKAWPAPMSSTSMNTRSAPNCPASASCSARAYPAVSSRR